MLIAVYVSCQHYFSSLNSNSYFVMITSLIFSVFLESNSIILLNQINQTFSCLGEVFLVHLIILKAHRCLLSICIDQTCMKYTREGSSGTL